MARVIPLCVLFFLWVLPLRAEQLRIVAGGDVYLGSWLEDVVKKRGADFPLSSLREIIKGADIGFANLEAPFTEEKKGFIEKEFLLRAEPAQVEVLKAGGIDVVSLANNHILDYGLKGLEDTIEVLKAHGIGHVGAGLSLDEARRPWIVETRGIRVAFLAYSNTFPEEFYATTQRGGTARGLVRFVREDVRMARGLADFVVVSFHWGEEGMKEPKPYQRLLARTAIDSGATVVVGHHPHVLQPVELYRDGLIAYSLGNLLFASYSRMEPEGMLLELTLRKDPAGGGLKGFTLIPIDVDNKRVGFRPIPKKDSILHCTLTPKGTRCMGALSLLYGGDQKD